MYHNFTPSQVNDKLCASCKHISEEHKCEICNQDTLPDIHWSMLLCKECYEKELVLQSEIKASAPDRLAAISQPDTTIQVAQDIFNAKIASIEEIRKAIEADATIENKNFALASVLNERFVAIRKAIESIKDLQTEQRAIQTYSFELLKKLTAEERAKIKITDVQYKPPEKPVKTPKAPTVKKYDKVATRNVSEQTGIPERVLREICVAQQVTPIEAARLYNEMMHTLKGE